MFKTLIITKNGCYLLKADRYIFKKYVSVSNYSDTWFEMRDNVNDINIDSDKHIEIWHFERIRNADEDFLILKENYKCTT